MTTVIERSARVPQVRQQSPFLLPRLSDDIPTRMTNSSTQKQILAKFALASEHAGVALPNDTFDGIERVLVRQWAGYAEQLLNGIANPITINPTFGFEGDKFVIDLIPCSHLDIVYAEKVIESLESVAAGLGWFVWTTIKSATHQSMTAYGLEYLAYELDRECDGIVDDDAFIRMRLDLPEGSGITAAMRDSVYEEYRLLPSDLLREVGGHKHLLEHGSSLELAMSLGAAKKALKKRSLSAELKACVKDAILMHECLKANPEDPFAFDLRHQAYENPEEYGQYEDVEQIGGICFLTWSSSEILCELVSHYEQYAMGGGSYELIGRLEVGTDPTEEDFRKAAQSLCMYMNKWKLMANLLSHFPTNIED